MGGGFLRSFCLIYDVLPGKRRNGALCDPFYFGISPLKLQSLLRLDMAATHICLWPMDADPAVHAVLPTICTFAPSQKSEFSPHIHALLKEGCTNLWHGPVDGL